MVARRAVLAAAKRVRVTDIMRYAQYRRAVGSVAQVAKVVGWLCVCHAAIAVDKAPAAMAPRPLFAVIFQARLEWAASGRAELEVPLTAEAAKLVETPSATLGGRHASTQRRRRWLRLRWDRWRSRRRGLGWWRWRRRCWRRWRRRRRRWPLRCGWRRRWRWRPWRRRRRRWLWRCRRELAAATLEKGQVAYLEAHGHELYVDNRWLRPGRGETDGELRTARLGSRRRAEGTCPHHL